MSNTDPFNLQRFVSAQKSDYEKALLELQRGRKETHWIWYIFPQVAGLGDSSMARRYAIQSRKEALAYLGHDVLGHRLQSCAQAILQLRTPDIDKVMGFPDNLKLKSSMTLFAAISEKTSVFQAVLDKYFDGEADQETLSYLDQDFSA